jgi:hypothetical protein
MLHLIMIIPVLCAQIDVNGGGCAVDSHYAEVRIYRWLVALFEGVKLRLRHNYLYRKP